MPPSPPERILGFMTPLRLKIKEFRLAKGWTQAQLAAKAGVRVATIGDAENGRTKGIEFDSLDRIANALGVLPQALLESVPKRRSN